MNGYAFIIIGIGFLMLLKLQREKSGGGLTEEIIRRIERAQQPIIVAGLEYNIPVYVLLRIAYIESRFDPEARGSSGELGMFQLTPGIISVYYNFGPWTEIEVMDTRVNATIAAWLLRDEINYWKQVVGNNRAIEMAVRSYNVGRSRADKPISNNYWKLFEDAGMYFPSF